MAAPPHAISGGAPAAADRAPATTEAAPAAGAPTAAAAGTSAGGFGVRLKVEKIKRVLDIPSEVSLRDAISQANGMLALDAPAGTPLPTQVRALLRELDIDEATLEEL